MSISRYFAGQTGVALPVEFASGDGVMALVFLAFTALLSAIPAVLVYRQPPAGALRT
ncbi:MAG: hypothetical protein QHC90_21575 [Shinella sp.]|nr:hypothetical protein [Shinella sp.]